MRGLIRVPRLSESIAVTNSTAVVGAAAGEAVSKTLAVYIDMSDDESGTSSSSEDVNLETFPAAHVELLQLPPNAIKDSMVHTQDGCVITRLPSGRTIDIGQFVAGSFASLERDADKKPIQSESASVFFQFFAAITELFDGEKYPENTYIAQVIHSVICARNRTYLST